MVFHSIVTFFGNFEIIKWAIENGCPWDEIATDEAFTNNNFLIFKYLIDNGCPFKRSYYLAISSHENIDFQNWLNLLKEEEKKKEIK